MGDVVKSIFGGGNLKGQADLAEQSQRMALVERAKQEAGEDSELARRPRSGQGGRRLLQYFSGDLATKLGG